MRRIGYSKNDQLFDLFSLTNWKAMDAGLRAPCLIQSRFEISGSPTDTYLDVSSWHKGVVFVNGFNIGRYFNVGPYRNLYVPAPLLKTGLNMVCSDY